MVAVAAAVVSHTLLPLRSVAPLRRRRWTGKVPRKFFEAGAVVTVAIEVIVRCRFAVEGIPGDLWSFGGPGHPSPFHGFPPVESMVAQNRHWKHQNEKNEKRREKKVLVCQQTVIYTGSTRTHRDA